MTTELGGGLPHPRMEAAGETSDLSLLLVKRLNVLFRETARKRSLERTTAVSTWNSGMTRLMVRKSSHG